MNVRLYRTRCQVDSKRSVFMAFAGGEDIEGEEINLLGQLFPGGGLRLSNKPDPMPQLIRELRKLQGMIQAELGESHRLPGPSHWQY